MAADLNTVIKQLTESSIIAQGKLENFVPPKAQPKSVDELVAQLVKESHLTQFQATQIKAGKAKALILGNYTILDKIGAGGMGQVFKAQHRKMKRLVAIKMLPPAMTKDAASLARFEREVEAAAKLSHPNIVAAHDADEANGAHFLVMEYVEGKDLSAMVKKDGPFPVNKAVNYILQAARGLEFAHGEGVVHRDIKPANLLLDKKGVVKILDMGLARIEQAGGGVQVELTGTGTIMGTVDYMAPEQALNTKYADQRADIYSLGMSLYYLLAGKAAYSGETAMEKLMAHQNQPIPSLQEVQTTVSKKLEAVFKKMVAKKIEDRYQTMSEVVEALDGLGYSGSSTGGKGDVASTLDISSADRKRLLSQAKKKPLGSITEVVASERTKYLFAKIIGGAFGTIIAPIVVFYLIRHLEKEDKPVAPTATTSPAATVSPMVVATNTTTQPSVHVVDDSLPKPMKASFDAAAAKAGQAAWAKHLGTQVETINSVGMRMTLIPPGEFMMGSSDKQIEAAVKAAKEAMAGEAVINRIQKIERPQHRVVITNPFLAGTTEVTIAQFRKFVEATKYITEAERFGFADSGESALSDNIPAKSRDVNWKSPGYAVTEDSPVAQITFNDACAYCNWLSEREQRTPWYRMDGQGGWLIASQANGYRLPTEAEWEFACRAGTTTQFSFGDDFSQLDQYAWFTDNSGGKAQPVALKLPNPFGLFDMHGNMAERCQDFFDEGWYEKSASTDPKGPKGTSSSSRRVDRGGDWYNRNHQQRSAYRNNWASKDSSRHGVIGFRIVRPLDPTQPETAVATTAKTTPTAAGSGQQAAKPWETPEFQAWVKATQALPAEKQIEAVSQKLMELNPGFDGKSRGFDGEPEPKIEGGIVKEVVVVTDNVTDISPVRAFPGLKELGCWGSKLGLGKLANLSPLEGLALTRLHCPENNKVSSLAPLQGMPLERLEFNNTRVRDLTPLRDMPLTELVFHGTAVADLSPLAGMKLRILNCGNCRIADLSQLRAMPLESLQCFVTDVKDISPLETCKSLKFVSLNGAKVTPGSVAALQKALPNCKIEWDDPAKPTAKKLAYLDPAFQQWVAATQKLPAEKQIEAVSKKLVELNPGVDGKLTDYGGGRPPRIEDGVVTELGIKGEQLVDLSPARALVGLKLLRCVTFTGRRLVDLSPLTGMGLKGLSIGAGDLTDLTPLRDLPLTNLSLYGCQKLQDLRPLAGMRLDDVVLQDTSVADLSPLAGMPLTRLGLSGTKVTDISLLLECKSLKELFLGRLKLPVAQVAALRKVLPNCKVEWDGPVRPKTTEPAASGTK